MNKCVRHDATQPSSSQFWLMSLSPFKVQKKPGPSPQHWFTVSAKWRCLFSVAIVKHIQLPRCDTERFLLVFLVAGSHWGQWGGSPKGLAAESNSRVLYFLALCGKTTTPSIWYACVYWSCCRSSGYCTVLPFSCSPRVLLFVRGLIEVVKDLPRSHAPRCHSLGRVHKVEGGRVSRLYW